MGPIAKADADPFYDYGYNVGYHGMPYYGHGGQWSHNGYNLESHGWPYYGHGGQWGHRSHEGMSNYGKRSADAEPTAKSDAEPTAKADADPFYDYGYSFGYHGMPYYGYGEQWSHNGYNSGSHGWPYYGYGGQWGHRSNGGMFNYGKRSADAEPTAKADADPTAKADADPFYDYGYNFGYHGMPYYGYGEQWSHNGYNSGSHGWPYYGYGGQWGHNFGYRGYPYYSNGGNYGHGYRGQWW